MSTNGTINPFDNIGNTGASLGLFRNLYVRYAPISVAKDPMATSHGSAPVTRFAIAHPMNSPGTAAPVNTGSTVSASESLSCITPPDSPAAADTRVSTTYIAAIAEA